MVLAAQHAASLREALPFPMLGLEPVGFISSESDTCQAIYSYDYFQRDSRPVFHEPLTVEMLRRLEVTDIFVCDSTIPEFGLRQVREIAQAANCALSLVDDREITGQQMSDQNLGNGRPVRRYNRT